MSSPKMPPIELEHKITIETVAPDSRIAHVDGAALPFRLNGADARVEAETLGAWLKVPRANNARVLAKGLRSRGILNDSDILYVRQQNSGSTGRPAVEVWLSRAGALKFAAHSRTKRGAQLLDLIVSMFLAVVDGTATPKPVRTPRQLSRGPSVEAAANAMLGRLADSVILPRFRQMAELQTGEAWPQKHGARLSHALRSARMDFEGEAREMVGRFRGGWKRYPTSAIGILLDVTSIQLKRAARMATQRNARAQLHLRLTKGGGQ